MEATPNSEMDVASSSSGTAQAAVTRLVGPPYRKRARNAVLNDLSLERAMGTKEKALDFEEFPETSPPNLDGEDQRNWVRIRKELFDQGRKDQATKHTNPRSFDSYLAHARQTLRMLQDVSAGTREKFEIAGCAPKKPSKGSQATFTKPKTNGIAKAKRAKSTKARDNWPSQHGTNLASSSSPAATAQDDDDADAMDYTPADGVLDSVEDMEFETPEQRVENDRVMRTMAEEIREAHPSLRSASPDTMTRIAHLVDMKLW